jgi:septal ring factor EnvC (AmiA/AmiB activator)
MFKDWSAPFEAVRPIARLPNQNLRSILKHAMKNRIGVITLVAICLVLGIVLIVVMTKASSRQQEDAEHITKLSNEWVTAEKQVDEQKSVVATLYKDRDEQKKAYDDLSNNLAKTSTDLSTTSSNLTKSEADLKATRDEVAQRDAKIADLESENQQLDKQASDLSTSITNLSVKIAETQKKLETTEVDNDFLVKELKRLTAEKEELERQFNDLTVLRAQVSKLKEELSVARRLQWIRDGLFANLSQKPGQKLMQGSAGTQPPAKTVKPAYDLNVEVGADGSVKVIPPLTNAAAPEPPK